MKKYRERGKVFRWTAVIGLAVSFLFWGVTAEARPKRRKVIEIKNAVKIVGKIQKPQAFYILHRSPLNYKGLEYKEDFIKKIIKSAKKGPF